MFLLLRRSFLEGRWQDASQLRQRLYQLAGLLLYQMSVGGEFCLDDLESNKMVLQDHSHDRETLYEHLTDYINRRCAFVIHTSPFSRPSILHAYFNDLSTFLRCRRKIHTLAVGMTP